MESVSQDLEGPDQLFYDQPIRLRAKFQRIGDLMSDLYFSFQIPDIYSKYLTTNPAIRQSQYEFQWAHYIGAAIIQNVAVFIGGQKIQEFDGSYLMAKAQLDYSRDKLEKWKVLVGEVPALVDSANGEYAGGGSATGISRGYPTVVKDRSKTVQLNRPSIFGQQIRVPLPFWFCDEGNALPLIGLQYHDCEIQITLNPINKLYTICDVSGFRVAPGVQTLATSPPSFYRNVPDYTNIYDLSGQIRSFLVDIGYDTPALNTWNLRPTIQTTYIYIGEEERTLFASTPLSFIVHQVSRFPFPTLAQRQLLDIEITNPIERLLFVNRRSDTIPYRNDISNLTNWCSSSASPYVIQPGVGTNPSGISPSGVYVSNYQKPIIQSIRVLCDGNEIQEEKPIDYFTAVTPWKYTDGNPNQIIPVYTFSLHSPSTQPSGSINASRIRLFQVEVNPYTLASDTTYVYDLTIYAETINFVEIAGGMGGLKYAL